MASKNDITGAAIQSGILSKQGRDNWDEIFPPKKSAYDWLAKEFRHIVLLDPDGWDRSGKGDGVTLDTKITKKDFEHRLTYSTCMSQHFPYCLFLDDQRDPSDAFLHDEKEMLCKYHDIPNDGWAVVRSYDAFVQHIEKNGVPMLVSFDHDLAFEHVRHYLKVAADTGYIEYENFDKKTGKEAAEYLVKLCADRNLPLPRCCVHSANDLGRANIKKVLKL